MTPTVAAVATSHRPVRSRLRPRTTAPSTGPSMVAATIAGPTTPQGAPLPNGRTPRFTRSDTAGSSLGNGAPNRSRKAAEPSTVP
jgi:hypothetical protein